MIRRWFKIFAHKFDWHYAPVFGPISGHEDGKLHYQRWCQWCGLRQYYSYDPRMPLKGPLFMTSSRAEEIAVNIHKEIGCRCESAKYCDCIRIIKEAIEQAVAEAIGGNLLDKQMIDTLREEIKIKNGLIELLEKAIAEQIEKDAQLAGNRFGDKGKFIANLIRAQSGEGKA